MNPDPRSAGMKCITGTISPQGIIGTNGINGGFSDNESGFFFEEKIPTGLGMIEETFAMIKPITATNHADEIKSVILGHGFDIIGEINTTLSLQKAEQFYFEHRAKPFFKALTEYMSSGPIVALRLRRAAAVAGWRHLIGCVLYLYLI